MTLRFYSPKCVKKKTRTKNENHLGFQARRTSSRASTSGSSTTCACGWLTRSRNRRPTTGWAAPGASTPTTSTSSRRPRIACTAYRPARRHRRPRPACCSWRSPFSATRTRSELCFYTKSYLVWSNCPWLWRIEALICCFCSFFVKICKSHGFLPLHFELAE